VTPSTRSGPPAPSARFARSGSPAGSSAVIIANGRFRPSAALRALVAKADLLICADGGLRYARALGRPPQLVVGDFDSSPAALVAWARRHRAKFLRYPAAKDKTDTELALDAAVAWGVSAVDFIAVTGGRPDHALANLLLLVAANRRGIGGRIHAGRSLIFLIDGHPLPAGRGDTLSLLALSETVKGITTVGLEYPLKDDTLILGSSLGVSNTVVSVPAIVTVARGLLLAVLVRRSGGSSV
jgi:thiamine pyrophosphokinase